MDLVYERIQRIGILPVIKIEDIAKSSMLGRALIDGGMPVAEITFRAEGAADAIRTMKREYPEMLVGAGTVLSIEQADKAIEAGAEFIVAPGYNKKVVDYVQRCGIVMIPGAATPTEIEAVMGHGIKIIKFFPAELSGGVKLLKAFSAPYSNVKFIPTGGINIDNLSEYLEEDCVFACGGSWMVKNKLLNDGNYSKITELCREAIAVKERIRNV